MREYIYTVFKGIAMGAANVIPGVSGGTIALITGIFERLIDAIKSFNITAIKLLFKAKFKEFVIHTDLKFLISLFIGVFIAIVSLARLFDYLFENYPVYIWAYFFGLVLASVYFVGKTISKWTKSVIITFIIGAAIAILISVLSPASENRNFFYMILCGIASICSMILPGLSGSFILMLMGNYQLVAIDAINNADFTVLLPLIIGAVVGLLAFSHFLSWIFKKYRNETISILTGFILGSLSILWPWQNESYLKDILGNFVLKANGDKIVEHYEKYMPVGFNTEVILAIVFVIVGMISIWAIEKLAEENKDVKEESQE
ncbi:MAG: DUF368 domain-containing protein [Bacteroidales bacterium]|nr:DUF368 domain-containing protein [Bacteroidales bacterium]